MRFVDQFEFAASSLRNMDSEHKCVEVIATMNTAPPFSPPVRYKFLQRFGWEELADRKLIVTVSSFSHTKPLAPICLARREFVDVGA